jgi:hypothetical protein
MEGDNNMAKIKDVSLSTEDKELLFDVLVNQQYALEIISSEIADIESGQKKVTEGRLKELNELYDRLVKAGF